MLKVANGLYTAEAVYDILDAVSQNSTIWSMVYDATDKTVRVAMDRKWAHVHAFDLE